MEQIFTRSPWKGPTLGSSQRAAAHGKDSHWRSLWRTVSRERDLTLEQGKTVRSLPPEGQGAAETMCDELTITPIPHTPAPLGGGGGSETGVKLSLGRREGWGEAVLRSGFIFSLSYSDELNSLFSPGSVCFVHESNW